MLSPTKFIAHIIIIIIEEKSCCNTLSPSGNQSKEEECHHYYFEFQRVHMPCIPIKIMDSPLNLTISSTALDFSKASIHRTMKHMQHPSSASDGSPSSCSPKGSISIHRHPSSTSSGSPSSYSPKGSNGSTINSQGSVRKRGRPLPEELKDDAYWERRRKNNEAAKRSRDARRAKENEIAIRAAFLEQENLQLRVEVAALKTEVANLRCLLYANNPQILSNS